MIGPRQHGQIEAYNAMPLKVHVPTLGPETMPPLSSEADTPWKNINMWTFNFGTAKELRWMPTVDYQSFLTPK